MASAVVAAAAAGAVEEMLAALDRHQLYDLVGLARRLAVASSPAPRALEGNPGQQDNLCGAAAQLAAGMFGVPVECLTEPDRRRPVVDARAVTQSVARSFGLRLPAIGTYFGQHHSTVLHALNKGEASPQLQHAAGQLREQLLAHRGAAA